MKKFILSLTILFTTAIVAYAQEPPTKPAEDAPVYQLFSTQNMWTFIKLNTRTWQMWQVQYAINDDDSRFATSLSLTSLVSEEQEVNGRFTLYPTTNIYNFIMLDQIDGRTWQVQWSTKSENRGIIRIY